MWVKNALCIRNIIVFIPSGNTQQLVFFMTVSNNSSKFKKFEWNTLDYVILS